MEQTHYSDRNYTEEEKKEEDQNQWNKLDDPIVETILAQLPTGDIVSCQSVCKRWESIILHSLNYSDSVFKNHHSRPMLFNLDSQSLLTNNIVYDMEISKERSISLPAYDPQSETISVFPASSGLVCYKISSKVGNDISLVVKNPLSRTNSRLLPKFDTNSSDKILGIAMRASRDSSSSRWDYKVFVVYCRYCEPNYIMSVKVFSSSSQEEEEEEKGNNSGSSNWDEFIVKSDEDITTDYTKFLLEPDREEVLVGLTSLGGEGQIIVYFINKTKKSLICLDTKKHISFVRFYNFTGGLLVADLIECGGRAFMVILDCEDDFFIIEIKDTGDNKYGWRPSWSDVRVVRPFFKFDHEYDHLTNRDIKCTSYGNFIHGYLSSARKHYLLEVNIKEVKELHTIPMKTWDEIHFNCDLALPFIPDFLAKV